MAQVSDCGKFLVLTPLEGCTNKLVYFARLDPRQKLTGKLQLQSVVTKFEAVYDYVTNNGSKFIFRTNKDAPNYRLVVIDFDDPDPAKWTDLIPEHYKDVLDWAKAINNNQLIVCYLSDVKVIYSFGGVQLYFISHSFQNIMSLYDMETGRKVYDFPVELGTIDGISGKRNHTECFYSFCSFLTPNTIYRVKFRNSGVEVSVRIINVFLHKVCENYSHPKRINANSADSFKLGFKRSSCEIRVN